MIINQIIQFDSDLYLSWFCVTLLYDVHCLVGVGIVILTARRQTCCGSSISTDTHVLFRVCLKRLSLSCGGTSCVSNDTDTATRTQAKIIFYETSCATGKRTVVICVQVSAVEQSQLLHRSWMYDGRHDGFSVQGWSSVSSSMGKSNLRKFSVPNCRLVLYSVLIISPLRLGEKE